MNPPQSVEMSTVLIIVLILASGCSPTRFASEHGTTEEAFGETAPFPDGIRSVYPPPRSTVSLSTPSDWFSLDGNVGEICVEVDLVPLLVPGTFIQSVETQLYLNGELTKPPDKGEVIQDLIEIVEDNEVVASGPSSQTDCWKDLLSPDMYTAEIRIVASNGNDPVTYNWSFQVIE